MKTCCKDCYPHCDFCIYAKFYFYLSENGQKIKGSVSGCKKHLDEHHQSMAKSLGYCLDFHCFKVKEEEKNGT